MLLKQRFPRLAGFFLNRLNPTHFTGLPLTLILIIFYSNFLLLSQLTEDVIDSDGIVNLDEHFTQLLYSTRTGWVSEYFYFISYFGTREAVFIIGAVVTFFLLYTKEYIAILAFWLVMAGTGLSVQYGKKYINRDRPSDVAYYTEKNFSFPSGHATTSMALYGFCAYLLYRIYRRSSAHKYMFIAAGFLIVSVGFSRIYLGVHYLSDVLAGFILGFLWILMGLSLMEWIYHLQIHKKRTGKHIG